METKRIVDLTERIMNNVSKVLVGRDEVCRLLLVSIYANGHVLLEDVPGVGKTMLAKCIAKSVSSQFKRVQFTPDLLPTDLTGLNVFNQKTSEFYFKAGPVFTNILLADEINRATPRTQSSLLECMDERQVTVDGITMKLDEPFLVVATQNPLETSGTFPLAEAQNDRFFCRLKNGFPTFAEGRMILNMNEGSEPFLNLEVITDAAEIVSISHEIKQVKVNLAVKQYIIDIIEETRHHEEIIGGISPRGSIHMLRGVQALAAVSGRDYAIPDDVKYLAQHCFPHRLTIKGFSAYGKTETQERIIADIIERVPVPTEQIDDNDNMEMI